MAMAPAATFAFSLPLCLLLALLPSLSLSYTTIDNASESASLWLSREFVALVDVRRKDEWDAGHLPNATFIPSLHETGDVSRLLGCEDCAIAVYCRSGRRSKLAAEVLEVAGFANVYDVLGVQQWVDVGAELVSDGERDPSCRDAECPAGEAFAMSSGEVARSIAVAVLVVLGAFILIV